MAVELSEEDFALVYEALRRANSKYSLDEVAHIVALEAKAWAALQKYDEPVTGTADQS